MHHRPAGPPRTPGLPGSSLAAALDGRRPEQGDVERGETLGQLEQLRHLVIEETSDAAHSHVAGYRGEVDPLAYMPGVEVEVPVGAVPVALDAGGEVGAGEERRRRIAAELLTEAEVPQVGLEVALPAEVERQVRGLHAI